ncbi:MAG: SRPBCC family protein [Thermoplasmata archaeon]
MVRIVDRESEYDAPIEAVWKLIRAHRTDHSSIHPTVRNLTIDLLADGIGLAAWDMEFLGEPVHMKTRVVQAPPLGKVVEYLEGPLAGSKEIVYFTPDGARTGVTVVGDFRSPTIPEPMIEDKVRRWLGDEFDEDVADLRTLV